MNQLGGNGNVLTGSGASVLGGEGASFSREDEWNVIIGHRHVYRWRRDGID